MQEKEMKFLIDKATYDKMVDSYIWQQAFSQINFYYQDIEGKLIRQNATVRVRGHRDRLKMQVKLHVSEEGAKHINQEYEKEMSIVPYRISKRELFELCGRELYDVELVGFLFTERRISHCYDGIEICLDVNHYLGMEDYELEIEYITKELPDELIRRIEGCGLDFSKECKGKFRRFYEKMIKENQEVH